MLRRHLIAAAAAATALFAQAPGARAAAPESQNPVRLAVFNTPDADFVTYVYGSVLQRAGYNVDFLRTDIPAHFTALEFGDIDVAPAVWSSLKDLMQAALDSGEVDEAGSLGVTIRETWWYPNYVADLCPGLPDWTALTKPDCVAALSTPESDGKINYLGTPPDWTAKDEERIAALGLKVTITPPGTLAAMIATMQGAIQRRTPIIGFGFVPHWLYGSGEGTFVEFPAYDDRCESDPSWGVNPSATGDCELARGGIQKLVNRDFEKRAPFATEILRRFHLTTEDVAAGISRQERDGLTAEQASAEWLNAHETEWSAWIK